MAFEDFLDAKRVLGVLGRRLARYGLILHPDKTRFRVERLSRTAGTLCRAPTADRARHCSAVILTVHNPGLAFPAILHKHGFTVLCKFGVVR
jgi:hypothetical protein